MRHLALIATALLGLTTIAAPAQADEIAAPGSIFVAAGRTSCAITLKHKLKCWGINNSGQVGIGMITDNEATPRDAVALGSTVDSVGTGDSHTCVLTTKGAVLCWGQNGLGQLGNNSALASLVPVPVWGMSSGVTALSVNGSTTCAIKKGQAWCWGSNSFGQLGDGTNAPRYKPVQVSALKQGVKSVVSGGNHACAIDTAKVPYCWGKAGLIGNDTDTASATPVKVDTGGLSVASMVAAPSHTCAIATTGEKSCWGTNTHGQLGTGDDSVHHSPIRMSVLPEPASVLAVGGGTAGEWGATCAIVKDGVRCFGGNTDGVLGSQDPRSSATPVVAQGLGSDVTHLSIGGSSACAIASNHLYCWGRISDTRFSYIPVPIAGM